jgi:hypothetical protein
MARIGLRIYVEIVEMNKIRLYLFNGITNNLFQIIQIFLVGEAGNVSE